MSRREPPPAGLLALVAVVVALVGCGGATKHPQARHLSVRAGLSGPQYASAGSSDDYKPTGRIIADNGFRPAKDGYSFENYGGGTGAVDFDTLALIDLFGPGVCVNGSVLSCQVSPQAQGFADQFAHQAGNGHCYGFSVSALRFFKHVMNPGRYGAATVPQLSLQGNPSLQRLLAEMWFTQALDGVRNTRIAGTPNNVLDNLIRVLRQGGGDAYTLSIAKHTPPFDGHAITPYAVEDKGGGRFAVLVYDNNFPLVTRAVMFDRNSDTWRYNGAPNPADPTDVYSGGADNVMEGSGGEPQLDLESMRAGIGRIACPFCAPSTGGSGRGGTYEQIALGTTVARHAHLVITDDRGRRTGIVGGRLLHQIPGSRAIVTRANQDWRAGAEPLYRIPVGTPVTVTVDGSPVRSRQVDDVSLVGPGRFAAVRGMQVDPHQRHRLTFAANGETVTYVAAPGATQRPTVSLGSQVGRLAYAADLSAPALPGGASLRAALDPRGKSLALRTPSAPATGAAYGLAITRVAGTARQAVSQSGVQVAPGSAARLDFRHLRRSGQRLPLTIRRGAAVHRTAVGG